MQTSVKTLPGSFKTLPVNNGAQKCTQMLVIFIQCLVEQSLKYTLLFAAEGNSNGSILFPAPAVVYTVVNISEIQRTGSVELNNNLYVLNSESYCCL